MKNLIYFLVALLGISSINNIYAQSLSGESKIGIRIEPSTLGTNFGASFLAPIGQKSALEGIISVGKNDMRVTGLYEYRQPLVIDGLTWYMGGGGHAGKIRKTVLESVLDVFSQDVNISGDEKGLYFGVDAITGLEYAFKHMPMSVSVDVRPALNLDPNPNRFEAGLGFTFRWSFGSGGGSGSGTGSSSGNGSGGTVGTTGGGSSTGSGSSGGVKAGAPRPGTSGTGGTGTSTGTTIGTQTETGGSKGRGGTSPGVSPGTGTNTTTTPNGGDNGNDSGSGSDHGEGWD